MTPNSYTDQLAQTSKKIHSFYYLGRFSPALAPTPVEKRQKRSSPGTLKAEIYIHRCPDIRGKKGRGRTKKGIPCQIREHGGIVKDSL